MALAVFQQFDPGSLYLERALGYETGMGLAQPVMYSTPGVQTSPPLPGGIRGVRFPKIVAGPTGTAGAAAGVMSGAQILGAIFTVAIPAAPTTGLTFVIQGTDDGTNPADLGLVALFAVQTKVIASGAYMNFGVPNYATTSPFLICVIRFWCQRHGCRDVRHNDPGRDSGAWGDSLDSDHHGQFGDNGRG